VSGSMSRDHRSLYSLSLHLTSHSLSLSYQYWSSSTTTNKNFYQALVDSCSSNGIKCGVYSSSSQWSAIFGSTSYSYKSSCTLHSSLLLPPCFALTSPSAALPLWYAHYDNNPSFSDFSSFGGWSTPFAKQYKGDTTLCSFSVDLDYAPKWTL
jgi:hypothetical protein